MNSKRILLSLALCLLTLLGASAQTSYKCTIQMRGYEGPQAYMAVSLVDSKGEHVQTLRIFGPQRRWYTGMTKWYNAWRKKKEQTDAVTGASIAAGDRQTFSFTLADNLLDKGYSIRFDSSVEDQENHEGDAIVPVTTAELTKRTEGKGYIKMVKISKAS